MLFFPVGAFRLSPNKFPVLLLLLFLQSSEQGRRRAFAGRADKKTVRLGTQPRISARGFLRGDQSAMEGHGARRETQDAHASRTRCLHGRQHGKCIAGTWGLADRGAGADPEDVFCRSDGSLARFPAKKR